MVNKEQHNLLVDSIIDSIGSLQIVAVEEEVEKDFEEMINDLIDYIGSHYYRD